MSITLFSFSCCISLVRSHFWVHLRCVPMLYCIIINIIIENISRMKTKLMCCENDNQGMCAQDRVYKAWLWTPHTLLYTATIDTTVPILYMTQCLHEIVLHQVLCYSEFMHLPDSVRLRLVTFNVTCTQ